MCDVMLAFKLEDVSYAYDKTAVLDKASFCVKSGSVHAILGMNGVGKSTVAKLLSGSIMPGSGKIYFEDTPIEWASPIEARRMDVATVYMSYELVDNLMVCENIYTYGYAYKTKRIKRCSLRKMASTAGSIFDELEFDIDPYAYPHELNAMQSLMVQLAMVVSQNPKVVILDDPFSLLEKREMQVFADFLKRQKAKNTTIIFTTSDIETAITLSDEITVIKDGKTNTYDSKVNRDINFYAAMMSDTVSYKYPRIKNVGNKVVLQAQGISTLDEALNGISFSLYKGEILGLAGMMGAGRSTLARALFGLQHIKRGKIFIDNKQRYISSPKDSIDCGIGYMHDTMGNSGVIDDLSIAENITLANIHGVSEHGFLDKKKEMETALRFMKNYSIHPTDLMNDMRMLTDGNKQKTIFCRWMFKECRILIMDKVTRGIDTSSKVELYNFMNRFAMSCGSILFISDDYNELVGMCDRILIMNGGRICDTLCGEDVTMFNVVDGVSGIGRESGTIKISESINVFK